MLNVLFASLFRGISPFSLSIMSVPPLCLFESLHSRLFSNGLVSFAQFNLVKHSSLAYLFSLTTYFLCFLQILMIKGCFISCTFCLCGLFGGRRIQISSISWGFIFRPGIFLKKGKVSVTLTTVKRLNGFLLLLHSCIVSNSYLGTSSILNELLQPNLAR